MANNQSVHIDTSQIPAIEARILSSTILKAVQAFYEDPENVLRFEAWRAAREKEAHNG